jgi:hypothetical protein
LTLFRAIQAFYPSSLLWAKVACIIILIEVGGDEEKKKVDCKDDRKKPVVILQSPVVEALHKPTPAFVMPRRAVGQVYHHRAKIVAHGGSRKGKGAPNAASVVRHLVVEELADCYSKKQLRDGREEVLRTSKEALSYAAGICD